MEQPVWISARGVTVAGATALQRCSLKITYLLYHSVLTQDLGGFAQ